MLCMPSIAGRRVKLWGRALAMQTLHLQALAAANVQIMVSGMSAKARGYDDSLLSGYNASFAMPDKLISLALDADTVLCY
jgi:hypothetical protein